MWFLHIPQIAAITTPCWPSPCNSGQCVVDPGNENGFTCQCPEGTEGTIRATSCSQALELLFIPCVHRMLVTMYSKIDHQAFHIYCADFMSTSYELSTINPFEIGPVTVNDGFYCNLSYHDDIMKPSSQVLSELLKQYIMK
jgi:hypothetical protein